MKDQPELAGRESEPETSASVPWPDTGSAGEAARLLLEEVDDWVSRSIERQKDTPWQGGHDEGTFASAWFGLLLIRPRADAEAFLRALRDSYREWARTNLHHGYYPRAEVHHGPENFLYFQCRFGALDPEDPVGREIVDDVVHHVGNWASGVPDWFDWERRLFRSVFLGTRDADPGPCGDINIPEHFRFVLLALAAYRLTGRRCYLDWAEAYTSRWLEAFGEDSGIPIAVGPGLAAAEVEERYALVRDSFLRAAPSDTGREVVRLEAHAANGTIDALIDLFHLTGKEAHRLAARRLCGALVPTVPEPHNHPTGMLLMKYRRVTGDKSLDDVTMGVLGPALPQDDPRAYGWESGRQWTAEDLVGIGRRHDMVQWMARDGDGAWRNDMSPAPSAHMLAYRITGEEGHARRALELALVRLRLAKARFRDGREHGCKDGTISAVVRGNGRCHNAGNVTGSLYPYLSDLFDICGIPTAIRYPAARRSER